MKKVLVLILASAFAGGAWAERVIPVQSVNQFGAIKVTGAAANMYVAVPFEGFDDNPVVATNVIHAAGLTDGTKMYIWNPQTKEYNVFKAASGKWTPMAKGTMSDDDDDEEVEYANPSTPVNAGTGVILERVSTSDPAYVYGQIPMSPVPPPTFEQGQTLVCIPSTNAMQAVNLNAFTWTGVKAAKSRTLVSGADYIQFRDDQNRLIQYYYVDDGSGWGLTKRAALKYPELVADGKALVPAGTAFWYYSNAGDVTLEWNPSGE